MTDDRAPSADYEHQGRIIDIETEVPGTPGQVWRAIATGPGITSWYVSHQVDERPGGTIQVSFGPGMEAPGRVAVWEPPHRVVFDSGQSVGLAFEWLVEARAGGSCAVRLVNSGFGTGDEWDDQYDAMREGWAIFLTNLRLHLTHFAGRSATPSIPMSAWDGPREAAWARLLDDLGVSPEPGVGDRIDVALDDGHEAGDLTLGGEVAAVADDHVALVVDTPVAGTAFLAAEENRGAISVSVWIYLYGDEGATAVERDGPRWRAWLDDRAAAQVPQNVT